MCVFVLEFSVTVRNEAQIVDLGGFLPNRQVIPIAQEATVRGSRILQYNVGNEHAIRPSEWQSEET